jgi:hypothetical protein
LYVEGLRKRKEYDELQHSEPSDRSKQFRGFVDDLSKRLKVPKDQLYENQYTFFSPDEIVPLPLHILLGLCNRIISDTYAELLGAEKLKAAWDSVKSTPAWKSGVADIFGLNGPELRRWERRHHRSNSE